jgi:hypothetical protein
MAGGGGGGGLALFKIPEISFQAIGTGRMRNARTTWTNKFFARDPASSQDAVLESFCLEAIINSRVLNNAGMPLRLSPFTVILLRHYKCINGDIVTSVIVTKDDSHGFKYYL